MGKKCLVKPFFFFFPVWHFRGQCQTPGTTLYTVSNICGGSLHRTVTVMLFFVHSFHSLTETAVQLLRASHMAQAKERAGPCDPGFTGQMDYYKWPWTCTIKQLLFKSSLVPKMFSSSPCT